MPRVTSMSRVAFLKNGTGYLVSVTAKKNAAFYSSGFAQNHVEIQRYLFFREILVKFGGGQLLRSKSPPPFLAFFLVLDFPLKDGNLTISPIRQSLTRNYQSVITYL